MTLLRAVALALLVVTVAAVVPAVAGGSDDADAGTAESPLGRASRVLVFSVPTLTWSDLEEVEAPNLEAFLDGAVVADLSVRSVTRRTTAEDAYATLNAGTRTEGTEQARLAFVAGTSSVDGVDPDGDPTELPADAFEVEPPADVPADIVPNPTPEPTVPAEGESTLAPDAGERYDGSPAAEEFARRTGYLPQPGQVFNLGLVSMRRLNESLLFGARVGALGEALTGAGVDTAVIANGDQGTGDDEVDYRREASVGLMDRRGVVERGRVGRTLLQSSVRSPFGTRYDNGEVASAFREFFADRSAVLVEASDMVRYEDAVPLVLEAQRTVLREQAIERSDELFGRLLDDVDPDRDAVVVVAPYAEGASTRVSVIGVGAPDADPGLLSSGTTRRPGFVQTVDVAPTILSMFGVEVPSEMEGTVMERAGRGGSAEERRSMLVEADEASRFRDGLVGAGTTFFVVAQLALLAMASWFFARGSARVRAVTEVATLAVLLYLPATFAAGAIPFHDLGSAAYWAFVLGVPVTVALAIQAATDRYLVDPLAVTLGLLIAFLTVDIAVGGPLQFNTLFGYTPTVAGRFNGMGNPAYSMFAAAGIILSALLAHRIGGRRGSWTGVALLAWLVVLDGAPFLGADVGGILSLVPACGVTAWMLLGIRIRWRTAAIGAVATLAVAVGFGLVDLTRPPSQQTHLGRLLADIGANGFEAFQTVVLRKLNANLSVLTTSVWTLMLPVVFAFVGFLIWKAPWRLRSIAERVPEERAAVAGLLTAMLLGFALNDSGISVPGMMLGVANASLVNLLLRVDAGLPTRPGGDVAPAPAADSDGRDQAPAEAAQS